jgi:membrane protein implicated in regulation of membrane protease activity
VLRFSCGVVAFFFGWIGVALAQAVLAGWFGVLFSLLWGGVVTAASYTVLLALLGLPQVRPIADETDQAW